MKLSLISCVLLGAALRAILILFTCPFEDILAGKLSFTDIDYKIYTDAAGFQSPYMRYTYRYPPVLSFLMKVNYLWADWAGKAVFVLFDSLATGLLGKITALHYGEAIGVKTAALYAFNPLFIYLAARGSCESISMCLMYLFWLLWQHPSQSRLNKMLGAIVYGLWVHFRVYPIILLPVILAKEHLRLKSFWKPFLQLGILSGGVFLGLAGYFYWRYGYEFLHETYLYHFGRKDHRHSISPLFYEIYLNYNSQTAMRSLCRFLPLLYVGVKLTKDSAKYSLEMLHFIMTYTFVSFNSVITMQYYMWVGGAMLLLCPQSKILQENQFRKALSLSLQWVMGVALWVWLSMRLEGQGQNVFTLMWIICLLKLFHDLWVLSHFLAGVRLNTLQKAVKKLKGD